MSYKVYAAPETGILFTDTSGAGVISLSGLASYTARISDRYDRGAGSQPRRYQWRFGCQWGTAPAQWGVVHLFLVESDGTYADGNYGTSDSVVSAPRTVPLFGRTWAATATANYYFITSGIIQIVDRYFSIIVYNAASAAFKTYTNMHYLALYPVPEETQV